MCSLFGFSSFKEMKKVFENVPDGYDENGRSHMYYKIKSLEKLDKRLREKLEDYDDNIKSYLNHINEKREFKINLKYFQYLAVLFTEIFLDFYFTDPMELMNEITNFGLKNQSRYDNSLELIAFLPSNLRNLAFWMATGSGKTIIMHINYLQFLKYNEGKHKINYDNILLITPNAGLTEQHMKELQLSNIPCAYYQEGSNVCNVNALASTNYPVVKVIEITKFTEKVSGEKAQQVEPRMFGNTNIVFADEAHKGSEDAWRKYREQLSENGFKFEYSATFGQVLNKIDPQDELLQTYAKSILFDYSYKYFYSDGYGKDYRIINTQELPEDMQYVFLLANALSFYEQLKVYESNKDFKKKYNIERPLWVFIGSRVQPSKSNQMSKDKESTLSDILKVVKFLHKFVNDGNWAVEKIKKILEGHSGILDENGNDVFAKTYAETKFPYLRSKNVPPREIYKEMLAMIFKTTTPGSLYLVDIKQTDGEIGLKIGAFGNYFGIINIGDKSGFLKYVKEKLEEDSIIIEGDDTSTSLFSNLENSKIDILIGSRKFVEGWNSWRVSNMGLINMGKTEGPLIIQLFGRGVRLKGFNNTLKRSSAISGIAHPKYLSILETLNVFGIQANYMKVFREYLAKEGVPSEPVKEYRLPTRIHRILENRDHGLKIPRIEMGRDFSREHYFSLRKDPSVKIKLDLRPTAYTDESREEESSLITSQKEQSYHIDEAYVDLFNWDQIYSVILEYKNEKNWYNLIIPDKHILIDILRPNENGDFIYQLYVSTTSEYYNKLTNTKYIEDLAYLEDLAIRILKKYLFKYYTFHKTRWEHKHFTYYDLTPEDDNIISEYVIKIREKDVIKFKEIVDMLESENFEPFYGKFDTIIKNVYIDIHLYQPLLADNKDIVIVPKGLNPGETAFIEYLRDYLSSKESELKENNIFVYVLRNRTRGKGIGFFERYGFYPDFIIWVKKEDAQHILFVEPHGLAHITPRDEEKIKLHVSIKDLEKELKDKSGKNITLDSFILSVTPYDNIKHLFKKSKKEMEESHILFLKDDKIKVVEKMLEPFLN